MKSDQQGQDPSEENVVEQIIHLFSQHMQKQGYSSDPYAVNDTSRPVPTEGIMTLFEIEKNASPSLKISRLFGEGLFIQFCEEGIEQNNQELIDLLSSLSQVDCMNILDEIISGEVENENFFDVVNIMVKTNPEWINDINKKKLKYIREYPFELITRSDLLILNDELLELPDHRDILFNRIAAEHSACGETKANQSANSANISLYPLDYLMAASIFDRPDQKLILYKKFINQFFNSPEQVVSLIEHNIVNGDEEKLIRLIRNVRNVSDDIPMVDVIQPLQDYSEMKTELVEAIVAIKVFLVEQAVPTEYSEESFNNSDIEAINNAFKCLDDAVNSETETSQVSESDSENEDFDLPANPLALFISYVISRHDEYFEPCVLNNEIFTYNSALENCLNTIFNQQKTNGATYLANDSERKVAKERNKLPTTTKTRRSQDTGAAESKYTGAAESKYTETAEPTNQMETKPSNQPENTQNLQQTNSCLSLAGCFSSLFSRRKSPADRPSLQSNTSTLPPYWHSDEVVRFRNAIIANNIEGAFYCNKRNLSHTTKHFNLENLERLIQNVEDKEKKRRMIDFLKICGDRLMKHIATSEMQVTPDQKIMLMWFCNIYKHFDSSTMYEIGNTVETMYEFLDDDTVKVTVITPETPATLAEDALAKIKTYQIVDSAPQQEHEDPMLTCDSKNTVTI